MMFQVRAWVRDRGAIGDFRPVAFYVEADYRDDVTDRWLALNGASWELHHIAEIRPATEASSLPAAEGSERS